MTGPKREPEETNPHFWWYEARRGNELPDVHLFHAMGFETEPDIFDWFGIREQLWAMKEGLEGVE